MKELVLANARLDLRNDENKTAGMCMASRTLRPRFEGGVGVCSLFEVLWGELSCQVGVVLYFSVGLWRQVFDTFWWVNNVPLPICLLQRILRWRRTTATAHSFWTKTQRPRARRG